MDNKITWLDFNTAPRQNDDYESSPNVEDIKARLTAQIRNVLGYLLPGVVFRSGRAYVGDCYGNPGESLVIELDGPKAGMWADFADASGNQRGDILTLWATCRNMDARHQFGEVMADVQQWLDGVSRVFSPQPSPKPKGPAMDTLGPATAKWEYRDKNGALLAVVKRYDPEPGRKEFRPWDAVARKPQAPNPRPLYNQQGIAVADTVVLVEGEKCADALINSGVCATTAMNGANAPVDKTDWEPLRGKHVILWPDNDDVGIAYMNKVAIALQSIASSITGVSIPDEKPAKWDAADAVADGTDWHAVLANASRPQAAKPFIDITDWTANRFQGVAPELRYLVQGVFPLGCTGVIAAMGGAGKSMLLLDLALKITCYNTSGTNYGGTDYGYPIAFGGEVCTKGSVVLFSAEDDAGEIHRRLERLDPERWRDKNQKSLMIIPLPDAGGVFSLFRTSNTGEIETTPAYAAIRDQLLAIKDLRLVSFDPLAAFAHCDINADPHAGQFVMGTLAALAAETGATVLIPHHMAKTKIPPEGPADARALIRGTTALVDSARFAYAVWEPSESEQRRVARLLQETWEPGRMHYGAVVKCNYPATMGTTTYMRNPHTGLLTDVSHKVTQRIKDAQVNLIPLMVQAIAQAAEGGVPYTHTGESGVFKQRHRLPEDLRGIGRNTLENFVQQALDSGFIGKFIAKGSTTAKWLDSPDGPFARGEGHFVQGSDEGVADDY